MKIEVLKYENDIADVRYTPGWLGKFFGKREKIKKFFYTGSVYTFGNERIWFNENGEEYGSFVKIDNFIRKCHFIRQIK